MIHRGDPRVHEQPAQQQSKAGEDERIAHLHFRRRSAPTHGLPSLRWHLRPAAAIHGWSAFGVQPSSAFLLGFGEAHSLTNQANFSTHRQALKPVLLDSIFSPELRSDGRSVFEVDP